ncbi:hypothetical protein ACH5RR_035550 [Cinchona calisaya]|uniref:Small ribosomal subunit protein mS38 n=1 Tax=Cinchona calisaya TaxID=153742 RepID=A0ABD2Y2Y8_9GENT
MAGIARKLLQKLPDQRVITGLNHQNPLNLLSPPTPVIQQPKFENHCAFLRNPSSNCSTREEFAHKNAFQIYPSFSVGHFLNPLVASSGLSLQVKDLEVDESRIMWADSVKKKRKRKMNKHKLRKLRKRLRGYS